MYGAYIRGQFVLTNIQDTVTVHLIKKKIELGNTLAAVQAVSRSSRLVQPPTLADVTLGAADRRQSQNQHTMLCVTTSLMHAGKNQLP